MFYITLDNRIEMLYERFLMNGCSSLFFWGRGFIIIFTRNEEGEA